MVAVALGSLTMAGHATAGGGLPDLGGAAVLALIAVGLGSALAARRLRIVPVLALLLVGQALAHVVLSVSGHHAGPATGSAGPMLAAHLLAGAGAALVLVVSDRLVDRWLALWATLLGAPRVPSSRPVGAVRRAPAPGRPDLTTRELLHHLVRRGPPGVPVPS